MSTNIEKRDKILKLREEGKTYSEISNELNCNRSLVAFYCNPNRFNIEKQKEKEESKIEYEKIVCSLVSKCNNINQVCKSLGKNGTTNSLRLIKNIIEKYNLDTSHFVIDYKNRNTPKKYSFDEIFCKDSKYKSKSRLKYLLIKWGIKDEKCECCGCSEWMNKPIPLQAHHKNGDNNDNRIENLQLLCPNCHSFTDNYCGKNARDTGVKKIYKEKVCPICGSHFIGENKFCSIECNRKWRSETYSFNKNNITKESIINAFKKYGTFISVGKFYGVNDNSIRKWCKKFKLPYHTKDMKEYISSLEDNPKHNDTNVLE